MLFDGVDVEGSNLLSGKDAIFWDTQHEGSGGVGQPDCAAEAKSDEWSGADRW